MINAVIPVGVNIKIDTDNSKVEVLDEFLSD